MRGKHGLEHRQRLPTRIIPARAGQTRPSTRLCPLPTDHPRACGANHSDPRSPRVHSGSSPRVRGKPRRHVTADGAIRIIPARAGQTCMVPKQGRIRSDHPRACGANRGCGCGERTPSGSSPRVRGKHVSFAAGQSGGRIIPARAGQTLMFAVR